MEITDEDSILTEEDDSSLTPRVNEEIKTIKNSNEKKGKNLKK
jgi:hypothetical protein